MIRGSESVPDRIKSGINEGMGVGLDQLDMRVYVSFEEVLPITCLGILHRTHICCSKLPKMFLFMCLSGDVLLACRNCRKQQQQVITITLQPPAGGKQPISLQKPQAAIMTIHSCLFLTTILFPSIRVCYLPAIRPVTRSSQWLTGCSTGIPPMARARLQWSRAMSPSILSPPTTKKCWLRLALIMATLTTRTAA